MEAKQELSKVALKICFHSTARCLVITVPYPIILGAPWLESLGALWDFGSSRLTLRRQNSTFDLWLLELTAVDVERQLPDLLGVEERRQTTEAHAKLVETRKALGLICYVGSAKRGHHMNEANPKRINNRSGKRKR